MSDNIKYIVTFVNKKNKKILCYLKEQDGLDYTFTKLKNQAFRYNLSYTLKSNTDFFNNPQLKFGSHIHRCINMLSVTEYYLYFNNIKKTNIIIILSEYNLIKEERINKIKKIFESKN